MSPPGRQLFDNIGHAHALSLTDRCVHVVTAGVVTVAVALVMNDGRRVPAGRRRSSRPVHHRMWMHVRMRRRHRADAGVMRMWRRPGGREVLRVRHVGTAASRRRTVRRVHRRTSALLYSTHTRTYHVE